MCRLHAHPPTRMAAPIPSVSSAYSGGLRPGPGHGAGPLIQSFEGSAARPLLDLDRTQAASVGLQDHGPVSRLRRPQALTCLSRWLAGTSCDSLAFSSASHPVLALVPLVAPAVSMMTVPRAQAGSRAVSRASRQHRLPPSAGSRVISRASRQYPVLAPARYLRLVPCIIARTRKGSRRRRPLPRVLIHLPAAVGAAAK